MSKVSERLAYEVEKSGYSARELATITDIPKSAMQRYISGTTDRIPLTRLQKIADALNISSAYLACWTDDPFFTLDEEKEKATAQVGDLTEEEMKLIMAYRSAPEVIKTAVDGLLDPYKAANPSASLTAG